MNSFDPTTPTGKPSDTARPEDLAEWLSEPLEAKAIRLGQRAYIDNMTPDQYWQWMEQQDEESLLRSLAGRY